MKNRFVISLLIFCLPIIFIGNEGASEDKLLTKEEAFDIAENLKETQALYRLKGDAFRECIEPEVVEPCKSDWVNCIDDAWVVQYKIGESCPVEHDGRLGLTFLIDAKNGDVLSRFPEEEYFKKEAFCQEDYECLCGPGASEETKCLNFVHGQLFQEIQESCSACSCVNNFCQFVSQN